MNPDETIAISDKERIAELEAENAHLRAQRKNGLQFETQEPERVATRALTHFPHLQLMPELNVGDSGQTLTLIEGENYDALRCLVATHTRRVDVICIDPPYGTGNKDFWYNDYFVDPSDPWAHSKWLTFMDNRLRLAKQLLAPGGYIAICIDDNEQAQLKLLLEQIFGQKTVRTVVVKMSEAAGVKMRSVRKSHSLAKLKEYVLFVGIDGSLPEMHIEDVPKTEWDYAYSSYLEGMTRELFDQITELRERDDPTDEELKELDERMASISFRSLKEVAREQGIDPNHTKKFEKWAWENAWRIGRTTNGSGGVIAQVGARRDAGDLPDQKFAAHRTTDGRLYLVQVSNGYTLLIAEHNSTVHLGDLWTDIKTTGLAKEGGVEFANGKKPLKLIKRLISAHPKKDAIVLDFFAGSGTVGEAVFQLNDEDGGTRQAILVTNNENNICRDKTYIRMQYAMKRASADYNLRYLVLNEEGIERFVDPSVTRLDGVDTTVALVALRFNHWNVVDTDGSSYWVLSNADVTSIVGFVPTRDCWSLDELAGVMADIGADEKTVLIPDTDGVPDDSVIEMFGGARVMPLSDILEIR